MPESSPFFGTKLLGSRVNSLVQLKSDHSGLQHYTIEIRTFGDAYDFFASVFGGLHRSEILLKRTLIEYSPLAYSRRPSPRCLGFAERVKAGFVTSVRESASWT